MNELEQLKKRIADLEQLVNYFVRPDRYYFQRPLELTNKPQIILHHATLGTPQDGTFEFDGTNAYFTVGTSRKTITLT